jgi:predicted nucleotidyltransferase component of viral defense system
MIDLKEIKRFYPNELHQYDRFILKEYLQYKILEIVFSSSYATKLVFIGGTCLRIVHQNHRFSEDLDFDNFGLTPDEFSDLGLVIKKKLELQGFEVEIKNVIKGAFHCNIRFPKLLMQSGLSGYAEEKILIQLDTEAQGFDFQSESYFLNKFDVFTTIKIAPLSLLLAQKFYAVLNRKRNKGRDFYDIVFLLSLGIVPDYNFLELKSGISNSYQLKDEILNHCRMIDMNEMAKDVEPFLFQSSDTKKIIAFEPFLAQQKLS